MLSTATLREGVLFSRSSFVRAIHGSQYAPGNNSALAWHGTLDGGTDVTQVICTYISTDLFCANAHPRHLQQQSVVHGREEQQPLQLKREGTKTWQHHTNQ